MAISLVGTANGSGTGASHTVDVSGISMAEGDIIVVSAGHGADANFTIGVTGDESGAFADVSPSVRLNDTWDTLYGMFVQRVGATPDATLTVTRTNNTTYGGGACVSVWRGVDEWEVVDGNIPTSNYATTPSSSRGNPPSRTPLTTDAVVIAGGAGCQGTGGSAFTVPSGMQDDGSINSDGSTSDVGVWIASYSGWTSGAYDPPAWTGGATSASSSAVGGTLVLKPSQSHSATVWNSGAKSANCTLSNGDLTAETAVGQSDAAARSTNGRLLGKWYLEVYVDNLDSAAIGISNFNYDVGSGYLGYNTGGIGYSNDGTVYYNNASVASYSSFTTGDVIQVAVNLTIQKIWFGKNGTWNGNPAAGTGGYTYSLLSHIFPTFSISSASSVCQITAAFDTADLAYSAPSGFDAWGPSAATGTTIAPTAGSVLYTGHVPTVGQSAHHLVEPTKGAITLTGYVPTVEPPGGIELDPVSGSIFVGGQVPTIGQSAHRVIDPSPAAILFAGQVPQIQQLASTEVTPGAGHILFSGNIPVIAQSALSAAGGEVGYGKYYGYH